MRLMFLIMMISSFFGLGIIDCINKNWRTGLASVMLGIVQLLIFSKAR